MHRISLIHQRDFMQEFAIIVVAQSVQGTNVRTSSSIKICIKPVPFNDFHISYLPTHLPIYLFLCPRVWEFSWILRTTFAPPHPLSPNPLHANYIKIIRSALCSTSVSSRVVGPVIQSSSHLARQSDWLRLPIIHIYCKCVIVYVLQPVHISIRPTPHNTTWSTLISQWDETEKAADADDGGGRAAGGRGGVLPLLLVLLLRVHSNPVKANCLFVIYSTDLHHDRRLPKHVCTSEQM